MKTRPVLALKGLLTFHLLTIMHDTVDLKYLYSTIIMKTDDVDATGVVSFLFLKTLRYGE